MTAIGLTIIDLITEAIDPKDTKTSRRVLFWKESKILSLLYNFEENSFPRYKDLVKQFGITAERIRQLHQRGLKRIGSKGRKLKDSYPICQVIRIIKNRMASEKISAYAAITNIWLFDLPDFPHQIVVYLLAALFFENKEERKTAVGYFEKIQNEERKEAWQAALRQKQIDRQEDEFNKLLDSVVWFDSVKTWPKESFNGKLPKRKVRQDDRYYSGTYSSAKCNREVQFESNQELFFIKRLEDAPQVIYYLEQPVTIFYNKSGIDRQYTPDFAVLLNDGRCFIVERKDLDNMMDARVHRRMEALIEFCEKNGMGLLLTDGKYSLGKLKHYPFNSDFEKELRDRLNERNGRTMFFWEYKELMEKYNATKTEFLAIVLKNNWTYYPFKFKLSPKSTYVVFKAKIVDKL